MASCFIANVGDTADTDAIAAITDSATTVDFAIADAPADNPDTATPGHCKPCSKPYFIA